MSRKQNKSSSRSSHGLSFGGGNGSFGAMAHFIGMAEPFKLSQTTSGVGCITTNLSGPSLTAATNVSIDPYTIGSRCALMANLFAQWRVNRLIIQYQSDTTSSGVANSQSGPTTTPSYSSRPFALGWSKDPSLLIVTHPYIVEAGGVMTNTCRDSRKIKIPACGWKWCSTTTNYAGSAIDQRQVVHGVLNGAFVDASTTAAATYGRIVFYYDLSFRYPQNQSVIGLSIQRPLPKSKEESKEQEMIKGDSRGWF